MINKDRIFVYAETYSSKAEAKLDYDAVEDLYVEGVIGTYDIALISKDLDGKVHVTKHEKPTQHGAVIGALIGLLFPPAGVVVGAAAGGFIGHVTRGMSRGDMKELGSFLEEGDAAVVVVGKSNLDKYLDRMFKRGQKLIEKAIEVDRKEFEKDLEKEFKLAAVAL